jgi:DNA invertase Pin-like site-specific DNA recombinase
MIRFAFYGRVSTEDQQDPESSKQWQLHRSRQLIEPAGGQVVTEFFDIGQSRSLPWKRRPEAARLLAALARADRGFEAVVIGEPQRAFYGNQFGLTFPVFTHYGVALWVPEVGGAIDPGSEAHDLVMTLFGGMSKGERSRIKTRVRTAMSAQAAMQGRFLGGRPPYGYRLADAGPHPNPEKANDGKRLHQLEPDPVTAPVVRRIFDEYLAGRGYFAIAERLTEDGIASPSGHDRARNRHRHGLAWGKSAVRAILSNPRYTGYQVWAKQRREEVLLDVEDVSAGHQTVMRWNGEEQWVWSAEPVHEAIVSMETFRAVQGRMMSARRGGKPRQGPKTERPYLFRGRLTCQLCGRKLQGSWHHGEAYYRCAYGSEYARSTQLEHPKVVYLRERDLLPHVDAWLSRIFDPENVQETCEAIVGAVDTAASSGEQQRAAVAIRECEHKLARYRALLEAGTDPDVVAGWISEVEAERRRAVAVIDATKHEAADALASAAEVRQAIEELGGLVGLLKVSDPKLRSRFYEEVGFTGCYDPDTRSVEASADIGVRKVRVGGGT